MKDFYTKEQLDRRRNDGVGVAAVIYVYDKERLIQRYSDVCFKRLDTKGCSHAVVSVLKDIDKQLFDMKLFDELMQRTPCNAKLVDIDKAIIKGYRSKYESGIGYIVPDQPLLQFNLALHMVRWLWENENGLRFAVEAMDKGANFSSTLILASRICNGHAFCGLWGMPLEHSYYKELADKLAWHWAFRHMMLGKFIHPNASVKYHAECGQMVREHDDFKDCVDDKTVITPAQFYSKEFDEILNLPFKECKKELAKPTAINVGIVKQEKKSENPDTSVRDHGGSDIGTVKPQEPVSNGRRRVRKGKSVARGGQVQGRGVAQEECGKAAPQAG